MTARPHLFDRAALPWAAVMWLILVVAVTARVALSSPDSHTVYPIYQAAADRWIRGESLYAPIPGSDLYHNPPLVAAALRPVAWLPTYTGAILWRWLNVAVLLAGAWAWVRLLFSEVLPSRWVGWFLVACLPPCIPSFDNAQSNLLLLGCLLWGTAAAVRERWWSAAFLLSIPVAFKIYPAAVPMLLAVVAPRQFLPRWVATMGLLHLAMFATQSPTYIWEQHLQFLELGTKDQRLDEPLQRSSRDLYLLLRVYLAPPPVLAYRALQLGVAGCLAGLIFWAARRGGSRRELLFAAFHLGSIWFCLLGPMVEAVTFCFVAPTASWLLLSGWRDRRSWAFRAVAAAAYLLLFYSVVVGGFADAWMYHARGPQPLAALLLLVLCVGDVIRSATVRRPVPTSTA